ncbi:MAG TPA: VOC family protein [Steroidobacteraceae bacterium]|nr:VOC family protein [Steroidobacteraceae bacterium]
MHKSKLAGFIIDCQTDNLAAATAFWSAALGMPLGEVSSDEVSQYQRLNDPNDALHVEVQAVDHPSRVHLDIETDDLEAEVLRLEALGARRLSKVKTWWVIEAPTGQRFCVVRQASTHFATQANRWE